MRDAFSKGGNKVEYHDYYKYRISYISVKDLELMFLFVTGLTDNFDNIKKELTKCKKEFLNLFEDIIQHKYDSKTFEVFDPTIDSIHRNLRPKISLVGFSGVGKTTITRLIKAEEIPMQHIPTITGDIATIKIGKLHFHLWDFAGQEQFSYLWNNFIKGSDAVLLITDSSLENVEKSKFFLELIKEQAPNAHTAIIGNKQDLEQAMKPEQIEKILGLKTYSMIAKKAENRDKMIQIVADILEMSAEVSPLLKPLLERDTFIEEATNALENAEFEKAANLFEKISDLCIELGDDSLGREFYEKAQKIRSMLEKVSSTQTEVKKEPTLEEPVSPPKEKLIPPKGKPIPPEIKVLRKEESGESAPKLEDVKVPGPPPPPPKPISKVETNQIKTVEIKKDEEKPVSSEAAMDSTSLIKESTFRKIDSALEESNEAEKEIVPKPQAQKVGLELNPEDFMVKQRPKTVTAVPKDAKQKLKTSPYGHVENTQKVTPTVPVNPVELIKPKSFIPAKEQKIKKESVSSQSFQLFKESSFKTPLEVKPPVSPTIKPSKPPEFIPQPSKTEIAPKPIPQPLEIKAPVVPMIKPPKVVPDLIPESIKPSVPLKESSLETALPKEIQPQLDSAQKSNLEKSLMDLKVKKASISKMALDLDMKELTGEITPDELNQKKEKLSQIEENINKQISEIERMLK